MPRKASRTLLDEQQAADMMARLQLAPGDAGSSGASSSLNGVMGTAQPSP